MSISLPKAFNEFDEARQKGFIDVKELKEKGKNIVGTYCVFTPWEIILAADAIPISLCAMSDEPIPEAEKHLPRNLCPLIKSSYGFAITDTCPYFYFSDLIVGETTCDGKKKMYEYMNDIKPVHVMQLPQTTIGDDSYNLWRNEMVVLKERIEKEFNVEITDENLKQAIKARNEERRMLKKFYELGTLCPPPITGLEILKVLYGATFKTDKNEQNQTIDNMIKSVMEEYNNGVRKVSEDAPRILITGCPTGGATEKVIQIIEENGGAVVCFENCTGVKGNDTLVNEDIDPIDALTDKYLNVACSCISPNDNRIELLDRLVDEYKVDGVVDIVLQACHTYNVETYRIKKFLNENKNIPYMSIETDYSKSDIGQLQTRISAFIEML
ncbi:benzoyl-CoA reductase/2-hydroxyglutaryl-CoA dehydratase subunit, BcrC/BadD/HgdB [Gottschalkia purinilytica]|uniref:Benzoyl-CoA reductase/2-hydroxyglutaryl-CoA dehydratase subunit, BcrC/BadD/HgdB n=1 Tax=Gottschalkia purinilytica TaxID=1503 RepID=A0A0L0WA78_GOTPU|nr:double-cubane-cluster-containing anaerobic reductase [Gottschalkia purinilytica]KNF08381.1 benzoyl-CoA reductase/2-hydroxyglutaryl-CoA dehydratase subunit, BcrC/BadD/HgdB [Gottschalkia purinilytica]